MTLPRQETIVAVATGRGGAIAVIRLSGPDAVRITDAIFTPASGIPLAGQKGYTLHYGEIRPEGTLVDDVLVSLFRAPCSYTGEEMIEISCHASPYIQQEILRLCLLHGARAAQPGEFTLRAFLAGKMDLSQAEAVAEVIASDNRAAHRLATRQVRGGYSEVFARLREQLLELVSLLELELDFSEEDVQFADRTRIRSLMEAVGAKIAAMKDSFQLGNIIKNGIPVAIVGSPNVGKSTLLNALVNEEKALVSDIAGTTRDVIEDTVNLGGMLFRFIDTAGIRETEDPLENLGISRTFERLDRAAVVLLVLDARDSVEEMLPQIDTVETRPDQRIALLLNKIDRIDAAERVEKAEALRRRTTHTVLELSAKERTHLDALIDFLKQSVDLDALEGEEAVVFNARHHEALREAEEALERALNALEEQLPGDLLAEDLREVIRHLGSVTGTDEITSQEVLNSIFSKFCVGK